MGGAVAVGTLELQHDLAGWTAFEPLVGNGRAGDIAAQAFELLALMSATANCGVSAQSRAIAIVISASIMPTPCCWLTPSTICAISVSVAVALQHRLPAQGGCNAAHGDGWIPGH